MSGGRVADGGICSSLFGGVNRRVSGRLFAHAFSCDVEAVGVVDETAESRVGESRIADDFVPLLDRNLACDDNRGALVTIFEDFEKIALFDMGERREAPVIQNQKLDAP